MGAFIVLEGGEGSGKSTQARLLYQRLLRQGILAMLVNDPGSSTVGDQIRRILRIQKATIRSGQGKKREVMDPLTELFLFSASRATLVNQVIKSALKDEYVVVCDRFTPSTVAYQGYGRGIPIETIEQINRIATSDVSPDIVFFLDLKPELGLLRVSPQISLPLEGTNESKTGRIADGERRFEEEPLSFHRKVYQGYLQMAQADPERWCVVDAALPVEEIAKAVWGRVEKLVRGGVAR